MKTYTELLNYLNAFNKCDILKTNYMVSCKKYDELVDFTHRVFVLHFLLDVSKKDAKSKSKDVQDLIKTIKEDMPMERFFETRNRVVKIVNADPKIKAYLDRVQLYSNSVQYNMTISKYVDGIIKDNFISLIESSIVWLKHNDEAVYNFLYSDKVEDFLTLKFIEDKVVNNSNTSTDTIVNSKEIINPIIEIKPRKTIFSKLINFFKFSY